jgi:hypothetical protein
MAHTYSVVLHEPQHTILIVVDKNLNMLFGLFLLVSKLLPRFVVLDEEKLIGFLPANGMTTYFVFYLSKRNLSRPKKQLLHPS